MNFEWAAAVPCAPIRTTATDLSRFMLAHLNQGCVSGNCLLQPATIELMHSPQFTNHPKMSGMAYGFLDSELNGQRVLWHLGESTRFITLLALIPEQNLGLFVSYNTSPVEGDDILFSFLDRFFPVTRPELSDKTLTNWEDRAKLFNGTYMPAQSNHTTPQKLIGMLQSVPITIEEGKLTFFGKTFIETEPSVFQQKNGDRVLAFEVDEKGQPWMFMGVLAFFQVPWHQTLNFVLIVLGISLLIFLSSWFIWPFRKKQNKNGFSKPNGGILWFTSLLGVFDISLFVWLILQLLQYGSTFVFPQATVTLISNLYWLAVPWTLIVLVIAVRSWLLKSWTTGWRIYYSLVVLASMAILWLVLNLNLLNGLAF